MSVDPIPPNRAAKSRDAEDEASASEAAAIRRRWITLGEALTVVAVAISALTLWNSWRERSDSEANRNAEVRQASLRATTLVLTAVAEGDRKLILKPASPEQSVQGQTIEFPSALKVAPTETTGEPRIEAKWFERPLENARNKAGMPDDSRGDERLPVAITTRFIVSGKEHEDIAIYDIGYTISGHLLKGHALTLRGLSLNTRINRDRMQMVLDARWAKAMPQK